MFMFNKANGQNLVIGVLAIVIAFFLIELIQKKMGKCPGCSASTMPSSGGSDNSGSDDDQGT